MSIKIQTDTERLRALLEEWEALKNCGDATSRDKKRALAGTFIHALPGLLDENERLRTALASIKFDADYHGKSCNFQSAECHHETYREMSEIAFRALEGHDAKG